MNIIISKLKEKISNDGMCWAIINILARIRIELRNTYARYALSAPNLYLGDSPIIRGANHIKFGSEVHVGGSIWIEAITKYSGVIYKPKIVIGDRVSFSKDVHITSIEYIDIGCDVLMGSRVFISDHMHGVYKGTEQSSPDEPPAKRRLGGGGAVIIEDNVWIGDNVVIVGPVKIGQGAIIGANSVIRHDVVANTIVAGVPAKKIKKYDAIASIWDYS